MEGKALTAKIDVLEKVRNLATLFNKDTDDIFQGINDTKWAQSDTKADTALLREKIEEYEEVNFYFLHDLESLLEELEDIPENL